MPVTWEKYFTEDIGSIADQFVIRVNESVKSYSGKITLITELLFNQSDARVKQQLELFQDKIEFFANETKSNLISAVYERRRELAANMTIVAYNRMKSAYDTAKEESGRGMKRRMLDILRPAAIDSADPIYSTIKTDLLGGLQELELILVGMFMRLTKEAEEQARIVAHNANIGVDENAISPEIRRMIEAMPKRNH